MRSLLLAGLLGAIPANAEFRAAAAKVDITPTSPQWLMGYAARQSTGVHDPIFHRVVILDDGKSRFILISTDVCVFSPTVYDAFLRELNQSFAIDPAHVW